MLSVVMLSCNRLRLLQQSLDSLFANTRGKFSLTVIDDSDDYETQQWLTGFLLGKSDVFLRTNDKPHCTGAARNQGIEASRNKFGTDGLIYASDNDVWFAPGWDHVLTEAYRQFPRIKVIGGGCHPFLQPRTGRSGNRFLANGYLYKLMERDAVSGYSWLLSWETWDKYGPLDAHAQGVRQSEDFALCQKIIKDGFSVGSVVPEVVHHTGLHDTFGERPPGWELIDKSRVPGVLYE